MSALTYFILIVSLLLFLPAEARTNDQIGPLIVYPTDDTWVSYHCPDCNYGPYHYMQIENSGPPSYGSYQQAMVKFYLSSITPGTGVFSATLHLFYWYCVSPGCSGREIKCHRITSDWDEDTATWDNAWHLYDHIPTDYATMPGPDQYSSDWMDWDVTSDVQDMVDGMVDNEGWMLIDFGNYSPTPIARFESKEMASYIPFLEIILESEDWPKYCGGNYNRGSSTSRAPETDHLLWSYSPGHDVMSSPAVVGSRVYFATYSGLYCLDAEGSGGGATELIWNFPSAGTTRGAPTVNCGRVYIGSHDYRVYCLDAEGNGDGATDLIWSYETGNGIDSSPAVTNGRVYIGSYDNLVYCLDAEGNGDGTTDLIWSYETGHNVISSPAVAYGRVYVGSDDFTIYCLDAEGNGDGTTDLIWSYTTGRCVQSSPTVTNFRVFVGSQDDNVYCLDARGNGDGTTDVIWSFTTGGMVVGSPAVSGGRVYVATEEYDMSVYCLDAEGNGDGTTDLIWNYTAGTTAAWVTTSPAVADGKVYVGSFDDKVYCLDAEGNGDGTTDLIWNYTTGDDITSSPAVAREKVYIGSDDNYIYCFGADPVPDPVQSSVSPWDAYGQAFVCPGTGCTACDSITVTVLDENGYPCPYSNVEIDLSDCGDLCIDSPDGLSVTADRNGVAYLDPRVGGCGNCEVIVRAKGVDIRTYSRITSADWDGGWGDGMVETADSMYFTSQFMQPDHDPFTDYNGNGSVDIVDLNIFARAMGHSNSEICSLYYQCEVAPDTIDFGTLPAGTTKDTIFTIKNTGSGALCDTISEQCDYYDLVSNGGLYFISSGDSLEVTVRFEPADTGTYPCSIETGDTHCCDVHCTGRAILPCAVSPTSIDFGEVYLGCYIDTIFTIVNQSLEDLTGIVTEACQHDSIISGGGPYTLAPGETLEVTTRFKPTALDTHLCVIETGDTLCCDVQCTGIGVSPYAVCPAAIDFGNVMRNCHSDTSFMIINNGCDELTGNISESCPHDSIISGKGPFNLAVGETLQVTVRFSPTASGTHDCVIESGDTLCSEVHCTGSAPYQVTPGILDFGKTELRTSKEMSFTIENNMCSGLLNGFVHKSRGYDYYSIVSGGGSFNLDPGESRNVTVRFRPTSGKSLMCIIDMGSEGLRDVKCIGECTPYRGGSKKSFYIENNPNPLNPTTEIRYNLPKDCRVRIDIYDTLGRRIITLVDKYQHAGLKAVNWDGTDKTQTHVASGIYFLRFQAGNHIETRKMVLLR